MPCLHGHPLPENEHRALARYAGWRDEKNLQIPPSPLVGSPEFVEKSTVLGAFMSEAVWLLLVSFIAK